MAAAGKAAVPGGMGLGDRLMDIFEFPSSQGWAIETDRHD
jgi:hypothetical protein